MAFNLDFLAHHGILGQKWGVRRFQYADGRLTPEGKIRYLKNGLSYKEGDNVFISGKVKYDEPLSGPISKEIDKVIKAKSNIHIGDAPGADARVQEYLHQAGYRKVTVYTTDKEARNNVGNWNVVKIDASKYEDEREARRQKDIAMTKACNKGVAISSEDDRPDSATSLNVQRMKDQGSDMSVWDYKAKRFI